MTLLDASAKTFSSSWHRVAGLKAALRPAVQARRQCIRDQLWYVLRDPMNNQFFRVSQEAYAFLCRLSPQRTIAEAWQGLLAQDAETALSQEEVVQLLGQLNLSNLLYFDSPSGAESLFERQRQRQEKERRAKWSSLLFSLRLPLFDPDRWLNRALPVLRFLFSRSGLLLWLLLLMMGAKVAVDQWDRLFEQAPDLLAPGNLILLYTSFLLSKLVHESSHAAACKRYGGEVHGMGIMLVVFTPMPYVDASASWGFRYRWQRVMVGAAGMLAEFALGAVAVMVWAWSAPGALHAIAYNTIFITTVTTILFNINPLLRFDGYYILTDLLNLPNLYQRAREQLRLVTETALFGLEPSLALDRSPLGKWLLWYGLLSLLYWGVVITSIILFVADQYLDLGIMMALFMVVTALVLPLFRLVGFLLFSPRLVWHRGRAILVSLLLLSTVGGLLAGIPVPERIRAPGVLEAIHFRELNSEVSGLVVELLAKPGDTVTAHQPLVRMEMPELELEWQAAEQQKVQVLAQIRQAEHALVADLAPLRDQLQAVEEALQALQRKRASLSVSAPIAGLWSAPEIESALGRWMARGSSLGNIIDPQGFRFVAVLPQVATHLFDSVPEEGEIRLHGQENINLLASHIRIVPFQHGILPSPALGWAGGGEIAVEANNPIQAIEPFFLLYALLTPEPPAELRLLHGRSGTLRVTLGSRPLLWQWERSLRQFFQQKYRL